LAPHPQRLSGTAEGREHIVIALGDVLTGDPIKAKIEKLR
jgi:hypothetical protein